MHLLAELFHHSLENCKPSNISQLFSILVLPISTSRSSCLPVLSASPLSFVGEIHVHTYYVSPLSVLNFNKLVWTIKSILMDTLPFKNLCNNPDFQNIYKLRYIHHQRLIHSLDLIALDLCVYLLRCPYSWAVVNTSALWRRTVM